ncbi:hypothetical protein PHYBOEH_009112 [Phytophthora boehmeriae]|uniref:Protein kinase domain-containing protein n=1 Tax=Phytophthora boehmeriae TaxID=109152 RepID=A0A8T1VZA7_9STRA|nr:hypothetical protein PHYBOEH_009112 [Phytophthora boehmeriae]
MRRYTGVWLLLQALWALQTSASRTFVLSRNGNATSSSSGATVISVQLSAASFGLMDASQALSPVVFDSFVAGAEWTLKNWSQPVTDVLGGTGSDQTVLVDVQFPDQVDVGVTKLLLQADASPLESVDLSLVFGTDALAGLTGLSQVHVDGMKTTFEDGEWLPHSAELNQLIFDNASVENFALETTVTIQQVVIRRSNISFPSTVLGLDAAITTLILEHNTISGPIQLTEAEYTQLANISDVRATGNTIDSSLGGSTSFCVKEEAIGELAICIVSDSASQSETLTTESSNSTSNSQGGGSVQTESTAGTGTRGALTTAAIVLACAATVVLVVVASFFRRFKRKASKFVEERLTFSNHEDVLLSDRIDEAGPAVPLTGNAKILADMDLGKDQVKVHKKLGVQGLWLGEYKDMKIVALRFVPRELNLTLPDLNAIRLSYVPLKHENIVHFLGSSWNDREEVLLVVEHMSKGSLRAVLADQQTELSWPQRIQMGKDISHGLNFLRSSQGAKLSRNLTAKSVLVNEQLACKLDIFDYASSLRTDLVPVRSFGNGDIASRAPELLKGAEITTAAEVYALGVIFCEISSRSKVFEHVSEERGPTRADIFIATEVVAQRLKPSPAEGTPVEFRQLILQCLAYEPSDRPKIGDVLKALST